MSCTVIGYFDDVEKADKTVRELEQLNIRRDRLSVITRSDTGAADVIAVDHNAGEVPIGPGKGAIVGGLTGLMIGISATILPGIGAIFAAGPLAAALGAGFGAASGAVIAPVMDMLMDAGVPESDAEIFAEGIKRGGTLLSVEVDDGLADEVEEVMERNGASDIDDKARAWSEEGWTRQPNASASTSDEIYNFDDNDIDDLSEAIAKDDRADRRSREDDSLTPPVRRYGRMT